MGLTGVWRVGVHEQGTGQGAAGELGVELFFLNFSHFHGRSDVVG
jgi:hypothetical protein